MAHMANMLDFLDDYGYDEQGEEIGCELLSIHEFASEYGWGRDLLQRIPNVTLFTFPDSVLKLSKVRPFLSRSHLRPLTVQQAGSTIQQATTSSPLLYLPAEIQVSIFKYIPRHLRPTLAKTCKTLARVAQTNGLLSSNPTAVELLTEIEMPTDRDTGAASRIEFPISDCGPFGSTCSWCLWHGKAVTRYWFRHLRAETSRLGLRLTVGMARHLAYESIYRRITDPENGCRDMGEVFMDSAWHQWIEDMQDELVSPIKDQLKMVRKNALSVPELEAMNPAAVQNGDPEADSDESEFEEY